MNKLKDKFKNLFAKRKSSDYFDKQGFFAIALLCLGVIGVAAYMLYGNMGATEQNTQQEAVASGDVQNVQQIEGDSLAEQLKTIMPTISIGDVTTSETDVTSDDVKPTASMAKYSVPLNGSITLGYSDKALIYSKTLKQWTTHMGVDISASKGDNVKAIAAGTVEDSYKDNMTGYTVIIDHGNGLKSYYANLASADKVKKGDTVKQGDVIGAVGDSAIFEMQDETHLHFEIKLNGKYVDPGNYFTLPVKTTATKTHLQLNSCPK